jgi:hypothetical protein
MAELESATERADQAILAGYENAVRNIQDLGTRAGAAADFETQAVQNLFLTSGERFGGAIADVQQQTGLEAGLAGTAFMPGEDFMNLLAADAAREAALTQRMGGIVGQEMTDAERRMAFQQASQQADLQRQSASQGGQIRADQMSAVNARIAQERRDFANNLRQLQSTYATLGAGFDTAGIQSYGDQAELAQSEALFLQQLSTQERMAAADRAARMSELEAQWGREDAAKPAWQTDDLSQALLLWDITPEFMQTPERYAELFGGLLAGAPTPDQILSPGQRADADRAAGAGAAAAGRAERPLVELSDEELEAERQRRAASGQVDAARAYYDQTLATLLAWEEANLIPRGTATERARIATKRQYPGVSF